MLPFDSLADKAKCDSVVLPDSLQAQLAGRGPAIRRVLSAARSSFLNGKGGDPSSALHVVGTDCSGLDTPIMALQSLQFKFRHLFSSEIARGPQLWISANFRPEQFYKNMLHRKPMDGFSGYMAGFPCQPWSVLNHTSKFFKDPRAKVIVAMIDTVMSGLPQWAIFENVLGLLRFLKIFLSTLKRRGVARQYFVFIIPLCPRAVLQEPARRPRLYFLLVRRDVAISNDIAVMVNLLSCLLQAARSAANPSRLQSIMFKSQRNHPGKPRPAKRKASAKVLPMRPRPKWLETHAAFRRKIGIPASASRQYVYPFHLTDRESDVLDIHRSRHPQSSCLVVDVSQSAQRATVGLDGEVTVLTTRCKPIVCFGDGSTKLIDPEERLLLQGIPLHKYRIPNDLSPRDRDALAGNAMHCGIAELAIMMAMSLVDWSSAQCVAGRKPQCVPTDDAPPHVCQCREDGKLVAVTLKPKRRKKQPTQKKSTNNMTTTTTKLNIKKHTRRQLIKRKAIAAVG